MRVKAGQSIALALMASLLLFTGSVQAASLGKIEVTSYIGEPFHALVPLKLDGGESASEVSVEIASPADYRIFEVYRDGALSLIRADVVSDGSSVRVEISSTAPLKSPFFNLILKTQKGRVTHFKKYPVFLELPKPIQRSAAETAAVTAAEEPIVEVRKGVAAPEVERFDDWARTGRYGPIVRGDTLYTVAQRLSVDSRYTRNQVMVALYEKNRDKFSMENINLLRAGSYLETPKAAEVERISARQASEIVTEHEKRWNELTKQPRYAAELLAQKTRYSKKISVGEQMDGVATAPAVGVAEKKEPTTRSGQEKAAESEPTPGAAETALQAQEEAAARKVLNEELIALREENANLQKQLDDSKKQVETLSQKVDSITKEATDASKAAVARLQTMVKQLQAELDEARKQAVGGSDEPDWLVMGLIGAIVLLLVIILLIKRREHQQPTPPAAQESKEDEFEPEEEVAEVAEAAPSLMEPMFEPQEQEETELTFPEFEESETEEREETEVGERDLELPVGEQIFKERNPEEMKHFAEARSDSDMLADYLQEADTYMRYGMDDEALQQVNQALSVKPDSVDAYSKKARILNNKGDRQGFEATVEAANAALAGDDLERFAAELLDITGGGEAAESAETAIEDEAPRAEEAQPEEEAQAESDIDFEEAGATIAFSNMLDEKPLSEEGEGQLEEDDEGESEEETLSADLETSTDEQSADEVEFDRADATIAFSQMLDGNEEPAADQGESATGEFEEALDSGLEASAEEENTEDEVEYDGADATITFGKMLDEKAEPTSGAGAESEDLSPGLDMEHGSTEELKTLLEEFPEEEGGQASSSSETEDDVIEGYELDVGGNTTREFNDMLNDFSTFESEDEDLTSPKVHVAAPEDEPEGAVYDLSLDDYSTREFEKITDFSDYEQDSSAGKADQEQSEAEASADQESSEEAEKKELDDLLNKLSDNEGEEEEGKE